MGRNSPHLGISLVTVGDGVLRLHQLFGFLNHLPAKTSDALKEKDISQTSRLVCVCAWRWSWAGLT